MRNKGFFAVQDRGIVGRAVISLFGGQGFEIDLDTFLESWVGIGIEIGVEKVSNLLLVEAEFNQRCVLSLRGDFPG